MENVSASARAARAERLKRKAKVMEVIMKHEFADHKTLHESLYIDDGELGEMLTEMLRSKEVEYVPRPKGKVALKLTEAGVGTYERLKGILDQSGR